METRTYTAFAGEQRVARGAIEGVLRQARAWLDAPTGAEGPMLLFFEDQSGVQIDFDLRGDAQDVVARLPQHPHFAALAASARVEESEAPPARSGPGRPKLGVVCREVSLLPRHWEWLERQSGGASVALRKLVEEARKHGQGKELAKRAREAVSKVMSAIAGHCPDFEEALRALYAKDTDGFVARIAAWPADVRAYLEELAREAARLDQ
jgi:hypothetical protein